MAVTVASAVAVYALGPASGPLVVSLALGLTTAVLLSLHGPGPLTVAFGCATVVVVVAQTLGLDPLIAGQAWLERSLGRHLL